MSAAAGSGSTNVVLRTGRSRGQSSVEFALVIPLVLVALLVVVQVVLVACAQLAVTHLAREVARALVVDPDVDVSQLVEERFPLRADDLVVEVHSGGDAASGRSVLRVSISYEPPPVIGMFDPFSEHFVVQAEAVMAHEP